MEADEFVLKAKPFKVATFLQEVLDLIYLQANRKHIVIKLEKGTNVPKVICSDQQRLKQVLLHLLINAVKYTSQYKTITIRVTLDPPDPKMVIVQVADQGIGIPREHQIKLFKLFGGSGELRTRQDSTKQGDGAG
jgi:signal transduction histidine kinase